MPLEVPDAGAQLLEPEIADCDSVQGSACLAACDDFLRVVVQVGAKRVEGAKV